MNEQEVIGYSVYVGIDWADSKHDVCICPRDSDTREFDVIRHCAEAIDGWVKDLHQRYGGRIAIAVELSKGPIVSALQKYDFIDILNRYHPLYYFLISDHPIPESYGHHVVIMLDQGFDSFVGKPGRIRAGSYYDYFSHHFYNER